MITPQRSLLQSERAVKALYVYANLRYLDNVDNDTECLFAFLGSSTADDVELLELEKESPGLVSLPEAPCRKKQKTLAWTNK